MQYDMLNRVSYVCHGSISIQFRKNDKMNSKKMSIVGIKVTVKKKKNKNMNKMKSKRK